MFVEAVVGKVPLQLLYLLQIVRLAAYTQVTLGKAEYSERGVAGYQNPLANIELSVLKLLDDWAPEYERTLDVFLDYAVGDALAGVEDSVALPAEVDAVASGIAGRFDDPHAVVSSGLPQVSLEPFEEGVVLDGEIDEQSRGRRIKLFGEVGVITRLKRTGHPRVLLNSREGLHEALAVEVENVVGLVPRTKLLLVFEVPQIPEDHDAEVDLDQEVAAPVLMVLKAHKPETAVLHRVPARFHIQSLLLGVQPFGHPSLEAIELVLRQMQLHMLI